MSLQSKQPRTFNPQMIDNIAAQVFWGYCYRTRYQTALNCVLRGDFAKLWTLRNAAELLQPYAAGRVGEATVKQCYRQTNRYMADRASQGKNIIGTLYTEDFGRCRPPDFTYEELVRQLRTAGDGAEGSVKGTVEVAGDLLIRTPLPSTVLLRDMPQATYIQVSDTQKALGFQKTMLLFIHNVSSLPANPQGYVYSADGVFQIPCPDSTGPLWFRLMPNSAACGRLAIF
jgi:hypothetical protein